MTARSFLVLAAVPLVLAACAAPAPSASPTSTGRTGMMQSGGMMGARSAALSCSSPDALPGTTVHVSVMDMGMVTGPADDPAPIGARMAMRTDVATVPAGQVSFVVSNLGRRVHELVVLPLSPGQEAGTRVAGADGKVDESGSLGEASASCAGGAGEGIDPSSVGWVTLDLAPGRYELVCNMTNHYADGMWQELVVT